MATSSEPVAAKPELRARLRRRRREIVDALGPAGRAEEAAALAAHATAVADALGLRPGDDVAAYDSLPTEPPTGPLRAALAARGLRVLLPVTLPSWDLDWVVDGDPDRPLGTAAVSGVRLLLVPALAVDRAGTRLGQGGGCYDRTLPRRGDGAAALAVLHPGELASDPLPAGALDVPVDGVLTAEGTVWLG